MSEQMLSAEERARAEESLYRQMDHPGERKVLSYAVIPAILLHVIILIINFPEFKADQPQKKPNVIVVKKYVPPPPKVERKKIVKKKFTKKVPIPDPTPDEPEPIREPEPEIEPEPLPPDVEFLIGVPNAPPPTGPLVAGAGGVTKPIIIPESRVRPEYPELARVARIEGKVILQAIVLKDGTVGDIEVLSCNRPGMGFEETAQTALQQWRYRPAMQGDRPVDVYFTVVVDFELN